MNDDRIFHLRFDRTQPEPKQAAFFCKDFRRCLYISAMPYQQMGTMMLTDAAHIQAAFDLRELCTVRLFVSTHRECVLA